MRATRLRYAPFLESRFLSSSRREPRKRAGRLAAAQNPVKALFPPRADSRTGGNRAASIRSRGAPAHDLVDVELFAEPRADADDAVVVGRVGDSTVAQALGGAFVGTGIGSGSDAAVVVGVALNAAAFGWSAWRKYRRAKKAARAAR